MLIAVPAWGGILESERITKKRRILGARSAGFWQCVCGEDSWKAGILRILDRTQSSVGIHGMLRKVPIETMLREVLLERIRGLLPFFLPCSEVGALFKRAY